MTLDQPVYSHIDAPLRRTLEHRFVAEPTHFIAGERVAAAARTTLPVVDPGTGSTLTEIAAGDTADIGQAVDAAKEAFERWRTIRPSKRGELLQQAAAGLKTHLPELATLETLDTGKPYRDASGEVWWAADAFRYYAGLAPTVDGRASRPNPGMLAVTVQEPLGVCAAITAWNYPMILAGFKVPAALAAGNSVVIKPAEEASLSTLRMAEILTEGGLPAGLVNVVTGLGEQAGAALVANDDVNAVAFTGSSEVGRKVGEVAGRRLIHSTLELGGKSPQLVCADADLDQAAPAIFRGIFQNAGQMCGAGSRVIAQRTVIDELAQRLTDLTTSVKAGHGLDPESNFGPLISERQFQRVKDYVDQAVADGAEVIFGGGECETGLGGRFFSPTMLRGLDTSHPTSCDEIFGPVLVLHSFDDLDEGVEIANGSDFGLGAGVWSTRTETAMATAQRIEAGNVWVNGYGIVHPAVPFGGFKDSGVGRELGPEHLYSFTEAKTIWLGLNGRSI